MPEFSLTQESYDFFEIPVYVEIDKFGGTEIPAIITEERVCLLISGLFDFIKIKNSYSDNFDTLSGFFLRPENTYSIIRNNNTINYENKTYRIPDGDLLKHNPGLYLELKWFGRIFGLDCSFNLRKLMVELKTNFELPVIREMRLNTIRDNLQKMKGKRQTDTIIRRKYPGFSFGTIDWSVNTMQMPGVSANTRSSVAIGSVIAGGETNVILNYDSDRPFTGRQQQYNWRFVNNNSDYIRQLQFGKIVPFSISSIYDPVVGVHLSNTPTTYRRSYGEYTLSDYTNPGWDVELFVNNILVDYQKADASGFYSFQVPLVYGNTQITLRYYGPWGEVQTKEQSITVPFNFVPQKKLEYRLSSGIVEDTLSSSYFRGELNYGLGRNVSLSGGVEYLSSITNGNYIPFVNTSFSFGGNILIAAKYSHEVAGQVIFNYYTKSGLHMNLDYTRYKSGQLAINNNYQEVRKASFSLPIRKNRYSILTRLTVSQYILSVTSFTNSELLISGNFFGISTNISTLAIITDYSTPFYYSNISMGFRLSGKINLRTHMQYDINDNKINSVKLELEKRLKKTGYISVSYEDNIPGNLRSVQLGVCIDLSFAQSGFNIVTGNQNTTLFENFRGSLQYNGRLKKVIASNRSGVGRGSLVLLPFLDLNHNNKYDKGEPKVSVPDIRVTSGRITRNDKDSTIVVSELEAYTNCFIEISDNNFDNISWRLEFNSFDVEVIPNQMKLVEIPVHVMGEVSGYVFLKSDKGLSGIGRMKVNIYNSKRDIVKQIISEYDGYFSYIGLAPGSYYLEIDNEQLKRTKMTFVNKRINININKTTEGDFKGGIELIVEQIQTNS